MFITSEEKKVLESVAKQRNLKIKITKEQILDALNDEYDKFYYFLNINPCPFYNIDKGCSIHKFKPVMCKIFPIRRITQISKKEYYFIINQKCNWVKTNKKVLEDPFRNLFKIFRNEFETYITLVMNYLILPTNIISFEKKQNIEG